MLKSEFWAEDIIQVVFTQLWQNRAELTKVEMPSSYLYRMVTNKARDRMRSHEREIRMQYWLASQAEVESRQKENREELHLLLAKAVDSLPAQRKEVYQLKYQQKLSYEEIATRLSISRNTVRNHMAKALEDIRTYMIRHADILLLILYLSNF